MHFAQCPSDAVLDVPRFAVKETDQLRERFGIGLADEFNPLLFQKDANGRMIFNDPIMDNADFAAGIDMRMRVSDRGTSVSRPASMRDADEPRGRLARKTGRQPIHAPDDAPQWPPPLFMTGEP